jgi:hypothetical protein
VPFRLPEDILGYYAKLLSVGGVVNPEKRHRVVSTLAQYDKARLCMRRRSSKVRETVRDSERDGGRHSEYLNSI